ERVFTTLLRYLDRSHFEPHLALLQAQGAYMVDIPRDVPIHDLKVSRVRYALPKIMRLTWKIRPQTILATMGHLNIALISARPFFPSDTKLLVREAVIPSVLFREESKNIRLWGWLYRNFYKRADKVVCLSDSMVNDLVESFAIPREKLVRIYNPVDIEKVRELAQTGNDPFTGPGPHLVAAGRICRQKGFDVLINAMPPVLERFPQAQLLILGEGPLEANLKEQARNLGLQEKVIFLGFQANPWLYLNHADAFILPSRYEGLPNVLLEALALGTPVVVSDCPGGIREIRDSVRNMKVVPPENPGALAEAIIAVCGNPAPSIESLGRFDLKQVVSEYSNIF
ncbi:MAG TPA: glycosyltransferase, partial [Ktedonobacteraceae bacterium]|nr:glycosyltransferase [Ktedonobacteraceae bacterium]